MKKRVIICILIMSIFLGGCQVSSDKFLSYQTITNVSHVDNNFIAEENLFAENLAVLPEDEVMEQDPVLDSGATLLINHTDKEIIYADNVYESFYPASLTKLLTALVALRKGEMTDMVTVSYNASHIPVVGAKLCGFKEGDVISLEALLKSMLIYSGNDASIAIAEHISGSEEAFVKEMNRVATELGAVQSNFVNSHGLHDDNQYTTAYDIYLIFNELLKYDTFLSIINMASYEAIYTDAEGNQKEKTFYSTNKYHLGEEDIEEGIEVIGGKTGTTNKAGYCFSLLCKDENGHNYIAIILKASDNSSLYSQMSYLFKYITDK